MNHGNDSVVHTNIDDLIHTHRSPMSRTVQILKLLVCDVGNVCADQRRKSGTRPDLLDLFPAIPDSKQNLGLSRNSKIPDRLRFSRQMKTRSSNWYIG